MAAYSTGNTTCPCINVTDTLLTLSDRFCETQNGTGIHLHHGDACVAPTYGSDFCLQHDIINEPACAPELISEGKVLPAYCFRPWCYVDMERCIKDSKERVYRSFYFNELDVFYSYSTCNSTADDWFEAQAQETTSGQTPLGKIDIVGNVPTYHFPCELLYFYWSKICFASTLISHQRLPLKTCSKKIMMGTVSNL